MPWFRLDDSFHSHPKVIAAGNEAIGLFVRCGTYAAEHLTDGYIPENVVLLYGSPALADTLVRAKLWRRARGGWQIPGYLDYNPSKEAVDKERQAARERMRRKRNPRSEPRAFGRTSGELRPKFGDPDPARPDPKPKPVTAEVITPSVEVTLPAVKLPDGPWLSGSGSGLPPVRPALEAERRRQMDALMREYPEVTP